MIKLLLLILIAALLVCSTWFFLKRAKPKYRLYVISIIVAWVAIGLFATSYSSKKHPVYESSLSTIENDLVIKELIGEPIKTGYSMKATYDDTFGRFKYPISGPNGEGTVHVYAEKNGGNWLYRIFDVKVKNITVDLKPMPNKPMNRTENTSALN